MHLVHYNKKTQLLLSWEFDIYEVKTKEQDQPSRCKSDKNRWRCDPAPRRQSKTKLPRKRHKTAYFLNASQVTLIHHRLRFRHLVTAPPPLSADLAMRRRCGPQSYGDRIQSEETWDVGGMFMGLPVARRAAQGKRSERARG